MTYSTIEGSILQTLGQLDEPIQEALTEIRES